MDSTNATDGFVSLIGGMNAGLDSILLQNTQYSFGLNVSSRGGLIHTRPAFVKKTISLGALASGKFQGSKAYRLNWADRIIFVIDGNVLGVNTSTLEVTNFSAMDGVGTLDTNIDRCYFCQADRYMIVQDGRNQAIIIDDTTARRADPDSNEVPVGTIMAYGHGRLFVVPKIVQTQNGRRFFLAGDIIQATHPEYVLRFTETQYLSGGGAFSMPNEMGFITGMEFLRNASTGSGLGALVVFAQRGVAAFAVNAPRATWQDIDISQVLFQQAGTMSPNSIAIVTNDLYFRGIDGIRSINFTRNELASSSSGIRNSSISREVNVILQRDNQLSLPGVEMAVVDNRLFCTAVPIDEGPETQFKALVVLDADPASSIGQSSIPVFDGAWTGLNFMSLSIARHTSKERDSLYVFAKTDGANELHMLETDGYQAGSSETIQCRVYTKAYDFGDPINTKEFISMRLDLSEILGDVYIRGFYRPFGYPLWARMESGCVIRANPAGRSQRRQGLLFIPVDAQADCSTSMQLKVSRAHEFIVQWQGYAKIANCVFRVNRIAEPPAPPNGIEDFSAPVLPTSCGLDLDPFGPWDDFDPFRAQEEGRWRADRSNWGRSFDFGPPAEPLAQAQLDNYVAGQNQTSPTVPITFPLYWRTSGDFRFEFSNDGVSWYGTNFSGDDRATLYLQGLL